MQYRKLGDTELTVSVLGFGTMRLPVFDGDAKYDRAIALIRHAMRRGINFLDVGTFYCQNQCEQIFGMATGSFPRKKLVISGKNSTHQAHHMDWVTQLKRSLSLFHRKYFDIYFIHYLKRDTWKSHFIEKGIIDQLQLAKRHGLFRYLGFSSHDTPDHVRDLIDTGWFEAVILPYNLLQRDYEKTMAYAFRQGLGVIVMNPLAGGALAEYSFYREDSAIGGEKQKPASMALNYVLSQPFVHSVLSGMESEEIIDENVATVHSNRYNTEEIVALNEAISHEKSNVWIPCTSCAYCLPCTQGIEIPEVIHIYNHFAILRNKSFFSRDYSELKVTAECCIRCNACVERCPHDIPISDIMEKASHLFKS